MIKIGNNISEFSVYSCQPKTKSELEQIIKDRISKEGSKCDLNDIDVSLVTNMSFLFYTSGFNGDISEWNVSNVKNMAAMFAYSKFNQDVSNWKINKDCKITDMFFKCPIKDEYKPKLPK